MQIKHERLTDTVDMPSWVWHEHLARFDFARRFAAGKRAVDAACGTGFGALALKKGGAISVKGFDLSPEAIEIAKKRDGAEEIRFEQGDVTHLPLRDACTDLFVSFETIEHITDDRALLKEVMRVLHPNGTFICSTPNRLVTNPGTSLAQHPWNPFHVREYSPQEFTQLLGEFFGSIVLFGQNPQRQTRTRIMQTVGRALPMHGAVRINQALKLSQLAFDSKEQHTVKPLQPDRQYEYLVAVCRTKRAAKA